MAATIAAPENTWNLSEPTTEIERPIGRSGGGAAGRHHDHRDATWHAALRLSCRFGDMAAATSDAGGALVPDRDVLLPRGTIRATEGFL
jgi:hypothetical protein